MPGFKFGVDGKHAVWKITRQPNDLTAEKNYQPHEGTLKLQLLRYALSREPQYDTAEHCTTMTPFTTYLISSSEILLRVKARRDHLTRLWSSKVPLFQIMMLV